MIDEHPDTPWALLAQRELKHPLGFKWMEWYVPARPREKNNADAAQCKNRNMNTAKPPPPPKL